MIYGFVEWFIVIDVWRRLLGPEAHLADAPRPRCTPAGGRGALEEVGFPLLSLMPCNSNVRAYSVC